MREPEGIATLLPGKSSERTWSKHREPDIRNAEAEGSSPFTSTKGQVKGLKWDPAKVTKRPERYVSFVEVVVCLRYFSPNLQFKGLNESQGSCVAFRSACG